MLTVTAIITTNTYHMMLISREMNVSRKQLNRMPQA